MGFIISVVYVCVFASTLLIVLRCHRTVRHCGVSLLSTRPEPAERSLQTRALTHQAVVFLLVVPWPSPLHYFLPGVREHHCFLPLSAPVACTLSSCCVLSQVSACFLKEQLKEPGSQRCRACSSYCISVAYTHRAHKRVHVTHSCWAEGILQEVLLPAREFMDDNCFSMSCLCEFDSESLQKCSHTLQSVCHSHATLAFRRLQGESSKHKMTVFIETTHQG